MAGAEICKDYYDVAVARLRELDEGTLRTREMGQPIYEPEPGSALTTRLED